MKNFSLVIIISAITALGGYLLGKSSPAQTQITATETNTLQDNSIKSSIYQMTKADMEEYSKLKNQKEKYNKANDILQKILKIFLLDLGLRISDSNYDLLKQSFDEPSSPPVDSTVIAKLDSNSSDSEILAAVKKNLKEQVGSTDWVNKENKASEVASDEDAKSFLKSVEIKDFFKSLKSLKPINKTQANVITGSFWGKANVYVKNQNVVWDVEMDIIDTSQDGQLTADTKIKMF